MYNYISASELYHYGIEGQKWGIRRFQNEDGSLTAQGRLRYSKGDAARTKTQKNDFNSMNRKEFKKKYDMSQMKYAKTIAKKGQAYATEKADFRARAKSIRSNYTTGGKALNYALIGVTGSKSISKIQAAGATRAGATAIAAASHAFFVPAAIVGHYVERDYIEKALKASQK